jgi:hypothetical protein
MNLTVIFILNYMPQADGRTRLSFYITQDIDTILENIIAQSFRNEDVRLVAKRTLLGLSATMPIVNLPTHGVDEALGRLTDDADFLFEPDARNEPSWDQFAGHYNRRGRRRPRKQ